MTPEQWLTSKERYTERRCSRNNWLQEEAKAMYDRFCKELVDCYSMPCEISVDVHFRENAAMMAIDKLRKDGWIVEIHKSIEEVSIPYEGYEKRDFYNLSIFFPYILEDLGDT